jgi:hypothetical protein
MTTVLTNTNIGLLTEVSRGKLSVLEDLARDCRNSLSEAENSQGQPLTPKQPKDQSSG